MRADCPSKPTVVEYGQGVECQSENEGGRTAGTKRSREKEALGTGESKSKGVAEAERPLEVKRESFGTLGCHPPDPPAVSSWDTSLFHRGD